MRRWVSESCWRLIKLGLIAFCLALLCLPAARQPAQAQQSPLDLLMQERQRAEAAQPRRVQRPRRATLAASVQRSPKRVRRVRTVEPKTIDAIIKESEPGPSNDNQNVLNPGGFPPLPGLSMVAPPANAPLAASAPPVPLASNGQKTILVAGDSLGIQLGQGLREAFAERPELPIDSRARADTGLVNTAVRNWPDVIRQISADPSKKPALAIMMIGANDNQRLPGLDGNLADQLSEPWRAAYAERIDSIVQPLKDARIPLIWVGMPVMKNDRLSSAMLAINGIYQERVERAGFTYLDIWDQFADANGGYTSTGPDVAGEIVRIRAGDGVHFTKAGSRKLAFFVEQQVSKALTPANPDVDLANLPADINEQIKLENAPPPPNSLDTLPSPDADVPLAFPVKPASGPIITLTAQPEAAQLTALKDIPKLPRPIEDVLVRGIAPYPKPGRGDDFTWPK